MGRNRCKPRLIPEQDKRICGGICLCQLTVIFSCVALVYLTVAIYMPSHRAFHSGFEPTPVTCQTWNTTMPKNCAWASCGEWCLTKTSGFCPQIHVAVRRNGSDVTFEDCTTVSRVACPPANPAALHKYNCNNGSECATLTGLFNCSLGHCANMSKMFQCHYRTEGMPIDAEKDNMKLNGFFECRMSRCTRVKKMNPCDRYCKLIRTDIANVYIANGNSVVLARCSRAVANTECNGTEPGFEISPPEQFWEAVPDEVMLTSCRSVIRTGTAITGTDCINGTLLATSAIPQPEINFTVYWEIVRRSERLVDPQLRFLPPQSSLTLYNNSRLYINLDGCVNTLQGECKEFLDTHGQDGKNQTAQSSFPCYYNKKNSFFVVARFNLTKVWRELIIAISIPSVLFVISFVTLCVITQSVRVGDDTKMRCKCCIGAHEAGVQQPTTVVPDLNIPHKPRPKYKMTVQNDDGTMQELPMTHND